MGNCLRRSQPKKICHGSIINRYLKRLQRVNNQVIKSINKQVLRNLELEPDYAFGFCNKQILVKGIEDEILKDLCIKIKQLLVTQGWKHIKKFDFDIIFCILTSQGLKQLGSEIRKRLSHLEDLTLSFWFSALVDKDFHILNSEFSRHLLELKALTYNFIECEKINFKEKNLWIATSFVNLQHYKLKFLRCHGISDESLVLIGKQISKNLPQLKHLELHFIRCDHITIKGIGVLVSKLRKDLINLQLFIHYPRNDSDEDLLEIGFSINKRLLNLKILELEFQGLRKITNEGIENFGISIKNNLKFLDQFSLTFKECKNIDKNDKEATEKLKNISKLKIDCLFLNSEIFDSLQVCLKSELF